MLDRPEDAARCSRPFGRFVDSLRGQYITAEDVGASVADMEIVAGQTRYVSGLPRTAVTSDGNPSPKTALGVYLGIKAAVKFRLKKDDLRGLTIAVQGLGGVGYELCKLLAADGAKLRVADVRRRCDAEGRGTVRRRCIQPGPGVCSSAPMWLPPAHWARCSTRTPSRNCRPRSLPAPRTTSSRQPKTARDCIRPACCTPQTM